MSILSRLHKGINSIGGTINGVIGIPLDLIRAPFRDDEYDGVASTLYNTVVNRGGQVLENTVGPSGIVSNFVLSPIPKGYRSSVYEKNVEPVLNTLETVGREGIREPIATLINVGQVDDSQLGFLEPGNWRRAYRIAQNRSLGQSLALGVGNVNINDEAELTSYMASDAYKIISGTADGLARLVLEPDNIVGGIAAKSLKSARALDTPEKIIRAVDNPKVMGEFTSELWKVTTAGPKESAAARIRSRFYPDDPRGAEISHILGEAETSEAQHWALRALMKDPEALARLRANQSRVQPMIERATARLEDLTIIKSSAKYPHPDWDADIAKASEEVDRLYNFSQRAGRYLAASGSINELPRVTKAGTLRESIVRSNYYSQRSTFSKPLHAIFDMNPQRLINASDHTGDVHLDRMLGVADVPREARDLVRSKYLAATSPDQRQEILLAAQTQSILALTTRAGMKPDEILDVLDNLAKQRGHTIDAVAKRTFDKHGSKFDITDENGEAIRHHLPASMSQDSVLVPLVDMNEIKKATTRIGQFRSRHPTTSIPGTLLESMYRVWKPAMLLRVGWPIKVIMDEQLRILAKIGTLSQLNNLGTGLIDYTTDYIAKARELGDGGIAGFASGIREVRGAKSKDLRAGFGLRPIEHNGYNIEGVYGIPSDIRRNARQLASASSDFHKFGGDTEETLLNSLREYGAHVRSVDPDHVDYAATYNWSADKLKQDPIAKLLLATDDVEEVIRRLRSTVEGTEILRKSSIRAHDVRNWVTEINDQIDHYTASNPILREKLANGKLTHDDLKATLGDDPSIYPPAHAEILSQVTGDSYLHQQLVKFVDGAYRRLGSTPTDILSRNRFMDHMYTAEVKRLIDVEGDTKLTQVDLDRISDSAREYALGETRALLYDLAESSQLARMLKFLAPFYSAWQEVLTRWTGLAIENPAFVARMRQIWQAPEKAGILTDEDGREIEWNVEYAEGERGGERYINLPASWVEGMVEHIPGIRSALDSKGNIRLNRKGLNMIMSGAPGAGPIVQIPVNEILKSRPDLESSVKFISPFGAQYGLLDQVLPSYAKLSINQAEEDRSYTSTVLRIWTDKVVEYNLKMKDNPNYTGPAPSYEDAVSEARAFYSLRKIAAYISPIALGFTSPYQLQIDAYRQAQKRYYEDPSQLALADEHGIARTPDEWFLDEYGPEFFALTQSVTRTINGIPPTLEAWRASKPLKDLIAANPEYGGLIVGLDGGGEFNSGVFNQQLNSALSPYSDKSQRETIPLEEAFIDPQRRLGWIEYRRFMDGIEAARIAEGLPNLQVKRAKDLAEMKQIFTQDLMRRNPAWADDFNQTDKGKWDKRIEIFAQLADNPQLAPREEFQVLKEYLDARTFLNLELNERSTKGGAKTLTASSNQDLKELWDIMTGSLIEKSLPFSALYYRYLENDPLGL